MRRLHCIAAGALVASVLAAAPATASVTVSTVTPGTDPYSGPPPTYDFESAAPTSGGLVTTGSLSGVRAQPFGSTGNYWTVGPTDGSPGTLDLSSFGDIYALTLLWGSVDSYNLIEFLDGSNNVLASFTGSDIFNPANGNQTDPNTNPLVQFNLTGSDVSGFTTLRLTSRQNAFEIDNVTVNPVPEPGTWMMMLLGFGLMGFAVRARKSTAKPQIA